MVDCYLVFKIVSWFDLILVHQKWCVTTTNKFVDWSKQQHVNYCKIGSKINNYFEFDKSEKLKIVSQFHYRKRISFQPMVNGRTTTYRIPSEWGKKKPSAPGFHSILNFIVITFPNSDSSQFEDSKHLKIFAGIFKEDK